MKRGTASRVVIGGNTMLDLPKGLVFGTDVILGGIAGLTSDFNGLVLSNTLMLGKKISHISVITVIVRGQSPLNLPYAIADSLHYVKAFGGTEQRNIPAEYTQVNYVTNTAQTMINTGVKFDFSKNYEIELKASGVTGSWYILQARESSDSPISGISGSSTGNMIGVNFDGTYVAASQISRVFGHIYYVKGTINNGNITLYVKDETAGTEETVTGTYTPRTGQSVDICLFGNIAGNYVAINSDVYFARIKEDGNYIMNYVPCRQGTTVGFYDKVSGTFKTASNLVADGNAVPTPDYPLDIISNNGVLKVSPNLFNKNASYALFDGYMNNVSVGQSANLKGYAGGDKTIIIKVAPNTTYTVTRATNLGPVYDRIRCAAFKTLPSVGSTGVILYNVMNATQANATFTTLSDTQYVAINVRNSGKVGNDWTQFVDAFQLEKGSTATPYMPYGEIYTDGTVETINMHGKNLFDKSTVSIVAPSTSRSDFIRVVPGVEYSMSARGASVIIEYDSERTELQTLYIGASTYTPAAGTAFARFNVMNTYLDTFQLEQGSTATTYEPYYDGGTATTEMLLKVGDYQDVQSVIDGVVTRNIGVKVLDGTENWTYVAPFFSISLTDVNNDATSACLCTHYLGIAASESVDPYTQCVRAGRPSGTYNNKLLLKDSNFTSTGALTAFLADQYNAGTPVIVIYPLATATTESVAGQTLQVTDGDNIVEITQASMNGLELEASYDTGVVAIIQEVQDVNLNNNVTVTIE